MKILKNKSLKLIYRVSRDTLSSSNYFLNVTNKIKGAHVTLVKSNNNIFGGYTDIPRKTEAGKGGRIEGKGKSFIFKLNDNNTFTVLKCKDKKNEVYHQ